MSDVKTQRVFVYGTLKAGHRNHHILKGDGAELIGETTTKDDSYLMKEFESVSNPGKFTPGVFANGDKKIKGELYAVTQEVMDRLDKLEELGKKYCRQFVKLDSGHQAWMYIEIAGNRTPLPNSPHVKKENKTYEWIL